MKKITYANGDSFVFGMEAVEDNSRSLDNIQLAFPRYIANHLQSETYINNAYCGATNEFIFRTPISDLEALERQGHSPEDIFVIIGITSLHRIEIDGKNWIETSGRHVPNGTIGFSAGTPLSPIDWKINAETFPREFRDFGTIFVNPSSNLTLHIGDNPRTMARDIHPWASVFLWTETVQLLSQEARILALHEFLKSRGYAHIFVNTVCSLERTTLIDLKSKNLYKIDTESFFHRANDTHPEHLRRSGHFAPAAHSAYADELIQYLQTTNIIA